MAPRARPDERLVHSELLPGTQRCSRDNGLRPSARRLEEGGLVLLIRGLQRHVDVGITHLHDGTAHIGVPMPEQTNQKLYT